ncbi:outer membrane protein [Acinetobacter sp. ANC 4635]|uniref:outer membrane protein n=1 Tax=Acinetobacter sp. ANC 4635 TaxID=2529846 RepID=UPI0013F16ABB|nr:outer membrane beta-barrel protein [Acinetobacter sp. ANC 4635]
MKKSTILIGALAAAISVPALAADGVLKDAYVSAKVGLNITDLNADHFSVPAYSESYDLSSDDKQNLATGAIAFGWNLEPSLHVPVRTELEYSAQQEHKFNSTYDYYNYSNGSYSERDYLKDAVKLNQQSVMWNTYFDWKNKTKFTPYFAVGVGATFIQAKGTLSDNYDYSYINNYSYHYQYDYAKNSKTTTNFVWSVGVGTSYAITPNLAADFSYKYIDSGKLKQYYNILGEGTTTAETNYSLRAHNLALGLRYSF